MSGADAPQWNCVNKIKIGFNTEFYVMGETSNNIYRLLHLGIIQKQKP